MQTTQSPSADAGTLSLDDIQPFARFIEQCEKDGRATGQQLRWWSRYRNENGLMASGALVEKRFNPKSRKPQLYVVVPRFVRWMATSNGVTA